MQHSPATVRKNFVHYCKVFNGCDSWTRSTRDCWGAGGEGKWLPCEGASVALIRTTEATALLRNTPVPRALHYQRHYGSKMSMELSVHCIIDYIIEKYKKQTLMSEQSSIN